MVKVDFLPRQYQIIMSPEDFLELILGLRQYVREFQDGTYRLQEMVEVFESKYMGDLPQTEQEELNRGSEPEQDVEGDVGGPASAK